MGNLELNCYNRYFELNKSSFFSLIWSVSLVLALTSPVEISAARTPTSRLVPPNAFVDSSKPEFESCKNGNYLEGYTLAGGTKAGKYVKLGSATSISECIEACCMYSTCEVAILLRSPDSGKRTCFQINCYDPESASCQPRRYSASKFAPVLFKRTISVDSNEDVGYHENGRGDIGGKSTCHKYGGSACKEFLDTSKLYYYSGANETLLDERLLVPVTSFHEKLTGECQVYALKAICYHFFPQCADASEPKPVHICQNECDKLKSSKCFDQFVSSKLLPYLKRVVPNCGSESGSATSSDETCVSLTVSNEPAVITKITELNSPISTKPSPKLSEASDLHGMPALSPAPPKVAQFTLISSPIPSESLSSHNENSYHGVTVPTVLNITGTSVDKETDLEVTDVQIRVSAGDNLELVLPKNSVTLFASTWPKEPKDGSYSYIWSQVSAPEGSQSYMEGKNSKSVQLTNLNVPGVYSLKLEVTNGEKRGNGFVNVTVKAAPRVNHPPRAAIYPNEIAITLPTNTVILTSESTDDDKIMSYKWEVLKGPTSEKTSVVASGADSKLLQLQNLVAGVYSIGLTVTDSDAETDHAEAIVTVNAAKDYPPTAYAGADVILRLPDDSYTLNGNGSSDDKGIAQYEWSKTAESPTVDMQGTNEAHLRLTHLKVGTYTFVLKVTDSASQSSESRVKIIVLPELNTPPVAKAGDDKELLFPDDSTTLDGSQSNDNEEIVAYKWEVVSGPDSIRLVDSNKAKVFLSNLPPGLHTLKLTVTDNKGLTGSDTVNVHVKKVKNEPPKADAGPDVTIFLPARAVELDGSNSRDDEILQSFKWTKSIDSPAAGDVLNGSDSQRVLRLANLVLGLYTFQLTVTDNKGLADTDSVAVAVKEDPLSRDLVELYLDYDITKFSEDRKKQLLRKISVLLEVEEADVITEEIAVAGYGKGLRILFFVRDSSVDRNLDGKFVADMIRHKIGYGEKLFEYAIDRIEPYVCRNNCSDHGYCDQATKKCVCDSFWMANLVKANFGQKESNCDWSVLYVSVGAFALFLLLLAVAWLVFFCFARTNRKKRRARYRALRQHDPDESKEEILLIPRGLKSKFNANSLTYTESDEDSEEETTVFDKKRLINGGARLNGNANGSAPQHEDHSL